MNNDKKKVYVYKLISYEREKHKKDHMKKSVNILKNAVQNSAVPNVYAIIKTFLI